MAPRKGGKRPKTEWPDCADAACKDPRGGKIMGEWRTPVRLSGASFGESRGVFCYTCWNRNYARTVRRKA